MDARKGKRGADDAPLPRARARATARAVAAPLPVVADDALPLSSIGEAPALKLDKDLSALGADYPNVAQALQYPRDVIKKKIPACKWIILAAKRHEKDLTRIGAANFPYVFDADKAERALRAMQKFREVKGPRAGHELRFAAWQKFVLGSTFGWVRATTRARRFRYVLSFVPRGNGKTTMAAPVGLYMTALDNEGGAEVYSAAVTRDQAKLVFGVAQFMANRDKPFRQRFGVECTARTITQSSTASVFMPLSRDSSSMDGLNVHCAILDELAQHPQRIVHDVLLTATGKRAQSLIFAITTSGSNLSGIGHEQWKYAQRVLSGEVVDEEFFAVLYTVDDDDDWTKPKTWRKANPNWNVSVMPDVIERLCRVAQSVSSQQNAFKMKHLNIWTNADSSWMNMQMWNARADASLRVEDFAGEEMVAGVDLSTRVDIAAKAKLFRREVDGLLHYYLFVDCYLPQAAISDTRNAAYTGWANDGYLHVTPGETNDIGAIEADIRADYEIFRILDVAYDTWQCAHMAKNLEADDIPVIEYRPTVANFSAPLKEIDALVRDGRFHHDGNPVLAWAVSCVRVQEDLKGNIFPRKNRDDQQQKIDPLIAALMAFGRWMAIDAAQDSEPVLYILGGGDGAPVPPVAPGSRSLQ